jgi:hypothetical protein
MLRIKPEDQMSNQIIEFNAAADVLTSRLQKRIFDHITGFWEGTANPFSTARAVIEWVACEPPRRPNSCSCELGEDHRFTVEYPDGYGEPAFRDGARLKCESCGQTWLRDFVREDRITGAGRLRRVMVAEAGAADLADAPGDETPVPIVFGGEYSDIREATERLHFDADQEAHWPAKGLAY